MGNNGLMNLTQMRSGQHGIVVDIQGGFGMTDRLNALGVRTGKRISKISSMVGRGPVTIELDRGQIAIGFNMAKRIFVEMDRL
jgi:ferrous iron transport protein A